VTGAIAAITPIARLALAASVMPSDVTGYGNSGASANITTGLVVATPEGGVSPFTYAWAQDTTSPYTWTIGTPTAASTSFTCQSLGVGNTAEATFKVTITDAAGTVATDTVTAFANNGQPYDGRLGRDFSDRSNQ
jgi:hypothetical protein